MADIYDQATDQEMKTTDLAIRIARTAPSGPEATGQCLNCGEPVEEAGRRWCCFECMNDWSKLNDRR
jgi:hypothetical protein